jgi:hypothetical protein
VGQSFELGRSASLLFVLIFDKPFAVHLLSSLNTKAAEFTTTGNIIEGGSAVVPYKGESCPWQFW